MKQTHCKIKAELYKRDQERFLSTARAFTRKYALTSVSQTISDNNSTTNDVNNNMQTSSKDKGTDVVANTSTNTNHHTSNQSNVKSLTEFDLDDSGEECSEESSGVNEENQGVESASSSIEIISSSNINTPSTKNDKIDLISDEENETEQIHNVKKRKI